MLAGQRQMMIVEEVRRRGSVRVSELTEQLGVSEMTVRRDLDAARTVRADREGARRCDDADRA